MQSPARAVETSALGNGTIFRLADVMDTGLQVVEVCVAPIRADQLIMATILDDAAMLECNDPVRIAHGREPMRDDEHSPAGGDPSHVLLDGALAFVIKRAGSLVEDKDTRVGNECASDRDNAGAARRINCCRVRPRWCHSPRAAPG